jgi:phospholipid transport system substrate-binding protein
MTSAQRVVTMVAAVAVALLFGSPAWAGPASDQLKVQMDQVIRVLGDPELKSDARLGERRAIIRKIANDIFDFRETTQRCLGRHWQARTPAERDEFVALFGDLLERSYIGKIELYSGEKIAFLGEAVEADQATVRTKLVTKQGSEIPVDYRMQRKGDRWLSYDVSIEGVSLVANYRAQFNKIIQTSSYPGLVQKMKAKYEESADADSSIRRASQTK